LPVEVVSDLVLVNLVEVMDVLAVHVVLDLVKLLDVVLRDLCEAESRLEPQTSFEAHHNKIGGKNLRLQQRSHPEAYPRAWRQLVDYKLQSLWCNFTTA